MPKIKFSHKLSDRIRLFKDRLARYAVTAGGISVLGALILIFIYLAWVVIPLFSEATLNVEEQQIVIPSQHPIFLSLDEYGQHAFIVDKMGEAVFISLKKQTSSIIIDHLSISPKRWFTSTKGDWFLVSDKQGKAVLVKPLFISSSIQHSASLPKIQQITLSSSLHTLISKAKSVVFTVHNDQMILAIYDHSNVIHWVVQSLDMNNSIAVIHKLKAIKGVEEFRITPKGNMLYLRLRSGEILVAKRTNKKAYIRDVVDVTTSDKKNTVTALVLLSGARSLLMVHKNGDVGQWFDVLKDGKRKLTHIRNFKLGANLKFILPNAYSKGFFAFYKNGSLQSHFTTSEKRVLFKHAYSHAPEFAMFSKNERKLVTLKKDSLQVADVDLGYPEMSFSALWNKVWYENYKEPEYVWQSTSANDTFEPKFSLIPIVFGTIKAAAFAMLFSIPIGVFAAIYTAYFMTPQMRRIVKPTIELMEALPTVIIGFLAALWFAPIVERHLVSSFLMVIVLPVATIFVGLLWQFLPRRYSRWSKRGWHALVLLPVLIIIMVIVLPLGFDIEQWLFGGDIRVFLAEYGLNFDQRNTLVVGLAMGFAVIPTIFTIAEDAVFSVPKHLSDGSMALGATQWQTLTHVVILTASPGIFSAIMMGLGRAVGETMIVLMATGNTPIIDWNILEGMRTLSATIAVELPESEVGSSHYRILFLAALILFIFTFFVNSFAEWIRLRLREKYRAL